MMAPVFSRCSFVIASRSSLRMLCLEIDHLAADHAGGTGGLGERQDQLGAHQRVGMGLLVRQHFERLRQQTVAGQDGRGLVELTVDGGPAAPQVGIVHGRQIVVDEAVAVHHFDGGCGTQRADLRHVEQARAVEHEERADALAAAHEGVAHGLDDTPFCAVDRRDQAIEGAIDRIRSFAESRFKRCTSMT